MITIHVHAREVSGEVAGGWVAEASGVVVGSNHFALSRFPGVRYTRLEGEVLAAINAVTWLKQARLPIDNLTLSSQCPTLITALSHPNDWNGSEAESVDFMRGVLSGIVAANGMRCVYSEAGSAAARAQSACALSELHEDAPDSEEEAPADE